MKTLEVLEHHAFIWLIFSPLLLIIATIINYFCSDCIFYTGIEYNGFIGFLLYILWCCAAIIVFFLFLIAWIFDGEYAGAVALYLPVFYTWLLTSVPFAFVAVGMLVFRVSSSVWRSKPSALTIYSLFSRNPIEEDVDDALRTEGNATDRWRDVGEKVKDAPAGVFATMEAKLQAERFRRHAREVEAEKEWVEASEELLNAAADLEQAKRRKAILEERLRGLDERRGRRP